MSFSIAGKTAIIAVDLEADIIHVRATVHNALHIGLGDNDRRRLEIEASDLIVE